MNIGLDRRSATRLTWYLKRLRAMGAGEILHRIGFAIRKQLWRSRLRRGKSFKGPPIVRLDGFSNAGPQLRDLHDLKSTERDAILEEANGLLHHEWWFWDSKTAPEVDIDWHRDPTSGKTAPRIFGFDIDHRDPDVVGDIKWTWEKNRHQHLTVLSLVYALTGEKRFADEVSLQIVSWIEQNPPLVGVNWTHPLEHGIRLISWVWCERLLRDSAAHESLFSSKSGFWPCFYHHARFISETYSRGSSANNHLIGEMAGLFIASCALPVFPESDSWREFAQRSLERALVTQTYPSGLNRELAFSYHLFVLEFGLLALAEARAAGGDFAAAAVDALRGMIQVIPRLSDSAGNLPRYGDGDDGRAVQLQDSRASRTDWLYELGRDLLGVTPSPNLRSTIAGTTVRSFLPSNPVSEVHVVQRPRGSDRLEEAGIYLLTSSRWTADEVFVLADAGPLGFLSIAAHGHADALSVALSVGGRPILVDPGTYTYYADGDARRYFRGTSAHNTLTVQGRDQSTQEGPMLWGRRASVRVLSWEPRGNGGVLTAEHNGYRDLGMTHRRRFCLTDRTLEIEDLLIGSATGPKMVDLRYHLHPSCSVRMTDGNSARIECDMIGVNMVFSDFLDVASIRGDTDGGWYSPAFSKREATTTLSARAVARLKTRLQTTIEVEVA